MEPVRSHDHVATIVSLRRDERPSTALRLAVLEACSSGHVPSQLCADAEILCREVDTGESSAEAVTEEIRALLTGLALRAVGIGPRCCRVADSLLGDLAGAAFVPWGGVTVPGGEDRANARTGIVELRFPAQDFWAIPAVAHELGHVLARAPHVGRRKGGGNPVQQVIGEDGPATQREELLCDFYAVYTLGPAYAAFMITERLDPALAAPHRRFPDPDPQAAAGSHPTPDKRVFVMLQTLARLDEAAGPMNVRYARIRNSLQTLWRDRLGRPCEPDGPDPDTQAVLSHFVRRMWTVLDPVLQCSFVQSEAALRLVDALGNSAEIQPEPGLRVLDVVAAAWRVRMAGPLPVNVALSDVATRALAAAEAVAR